MGPPPGAHPGAADARPAGFTEFVPLPFVHMATPIYLQRKARRGPTFREALLMHAVGRIAYRGCHRQHPGELGEDGRRRAPCQVLRAGVNDLGGTLMDENISRAAGASHGQLMGEADFAAVVRAPRPRASSSAPPSTGVCPPPAEPWPTTAGPVPRHARHRALPRGRHRRAEDRPELDRTRPGIVEPARLGRGHRAPSSTAHLRHRRPHWPPITPSRST